MARAVTRTRYPRRAAARRRPRARRAKGIDWGKVALFGAGAFILYAVFKPKSAYAVTIPPQRVKAAMAQGLTLEQALDALIAEGAAARAAESRTDFPRFSIYSVAGGPKKCWDSVAKAETTMGHCNTCMSTVRSGALFDHCFPVRSK